MGIAPAAIRHEAYLVVDVELRGAELELVELVVRLGLLDFAAVVSFLALVLELASLLLHIK